jgi:hypothetical protein
MKIIFISLLIMLTIGCAGSDENDPQKIDDDKFLGSWKYYTSIPKRNPNDHSMNGVICELERYKNTQQTYVFHLFTGNELILSIRDENTLVGENANLSVNYDESTGHLMLITSPENRIVFSKLK